MEYIDDTTIRVTTEFEESTLEFISVYAPDIGKPTEERENFFSSLQEMVKSIPEPNRIFIMGDPNSRIGITRYQEWQRFNEETLNENDELLINLYMDQKIRINNTFFQHKKQHKTTWLNTRGSTSVIDYIRTNRNAHPT